MTPPSLTFCVGQGCKCGGNTGVAVVAGVLRQPISARSHFRLVSMSSVKGRESRIGDVGVCAFVVGGTGERRIHDHQIDSRKSGISVRIWAAVSSPALPVRMAGSLVLKSVMTLEDWSNSSEPIMTPPSFWRP